MLPMLNGAVWIALEGERIRETRIALGPVADRPLRMAKAEDLLKGVKWREEGVIVKAAEVASEETKPRDSLLRGSAAYRRELVKTLVNRGLKGALERARGKKEEVD